jgi:hypothetical protein
MGGPHCSASARYVSERSKGMVSLLGPVRLERAYYHCAACGQGSCPWDGELGVTEATVSPAAAEVACIAGVQPSFAEASEKVLPKLAGLRVAESTVERSTEAAGERLAAAQASGQASAPAQAWASAIPGCLYRPVKWGWARGSSCALVSCGHASPQESDLRSNCRSFSDHFRCRGRCARR